MIKMNFTEVGSGWNVGVGVADHVTDLIFDIVLKSVGKSVSDPFWGPNEGEYIAHIFTKIVRQDG